MLQQRSVENVGAGRDRGKSSDREIKGSRSLPLILYFKVMTYTPFLIISVCIQVCYDHCDCI